MSNKKPIGFTVDKYHPIPGEMDTIDCLRKERDELKEKVKELEKQLDDHICLESQGL